jgi:hypothetical protein
MNKSDTIGELAKALAAAQGAMTAAKMDATNPFLRNKYADLGSVINATKQPMKDNGLAVSQLVGGNGDVVTITTLLMHLSGEWLSTDITLPINDAKGLSQAQAMGAVITYLRRYSLAAILGVHADDDTDGNETQKKTAPVARPAPQPEPVQPEQPAPAAPTMTIEQAEAEWSKSAGAPYGTLETAVLANYFHGLSKAKGPLTEEQQRKKYAIELIMTARSEGRPVVQVEKPAPATPETEDEPERLF